MRKADRDEMFLMISKNLTRTRGCAAVLPPLAISACANYDLLPRPPQGYDAIRLNRQVVISQGALRSSITFQAGTLLVADRKAKDGNDVYYCGLGIEDSSVAVSKCVTYDGKSLAITFPMTGEKYETPVTSQDLVETKN